MSINKLLKCSLISSRQIKKVFNVVLTVKCLSNCPAMDGCHTDIHCIFIYFSCFFPVVHCTSSVI